MEDKFFLHRIRKDGDTFSAGIEVHDTLDSAIQSFHSQMKMAYNNPSYPNMKYVSCMVTDEEDKVVPGYNETWDKEKVRDFFVHYIRHDGDNYTKIFLKGIISEKDRVSIFNFISFINCNLHTLLIWVILVFCFVKNFSFREYTRQ